jgi:dihydroxyacetone kinase
MSFFLSISNFKTAVLRVCQVIGAEQEYLTNLDQAVGDGDLGITMTKISMALQEYTRTNTEVNDIGQFLIGAGMATNRAASSSFGTLMSTALINAGSQIKGCNRVSSVQLYEIFFAAVLAIQNRGKAQLNDKTVLDVFFPAAEAFKKAIDTGASNKDAGICLVKAAKEGLDHVTPMQSRIGRASWLGEQTKGKIDPGCAAAVIILEAIVRQ